MQNVKLQPTDIKSRSYKYSLDVIRYLKRLDQKDIVIITIVKQLIRSATSVAANVMEAQAASSRKDFTNFINHSLKSVNESKFWLELLKDLGFEHESLLIESRELGAILGASLVTLRGIH